MKKYDYLLVGSGLFSAVFASMASSRGKTCLVLEKRREIGGNLRCKDVENICVHEYGAHIFHTSNETVWRYVNQYTEFNHFINTPIANYKGEIYNLPFNMNTFNKMWGITTPAEAKAIIEKQRACITEPPFNLEEQAICLVGEDIYRKLIKGYTEKQWGRKCSELPPFIIKRLPVRFEYNNNYFSDIYQGIPIEGYNSMIEKMFKGCQIETSVDYNTSPDTWNTMAEHIIYTGSIDAFFKYCFGELEYRSLRFETEILDEENHQGVAVMNYTDEESPFTRIIEHKHFVFGKQKKTVITKEYPELWRRGMEPYYPVNDEKNKKLYQRYLQMAKQQQKVFFGGRLGEYQYYDMDKVIESAMNLAQRLL